MPNRQDAIAAAEKWFDDGHLLDAVRRRVAHRTESQRGDALRDLRRYLTDEIGPSLAALGFALRIVENPVPGAGPFLIAVRHEDDAVPTAFMYGHGDVVLGYDAQWRAGLSPWSVTVEGDRWYGRGTADNKGQHSINVAALGQVLATRGRLGFNVKFLLETGEETGSPGLRAICESERVALAADVFIASDGPRLNARRPTLFLGSRGVVQFRPDRRPARREPPLRQLGWPPRQPRHDPRQRDRIACRCARPHPRRRIASAADTGLGAPRAGRHRAG